MEQKKLYVILIGIIVVLAGGTLAINLISVSASEDYNVNIISGTEYIPFEPGQIMVELRDRQFNPINATCKASILYPDKSYFVQDELMTSIDLGTQYYDFTIPSVHGVYEYSVNCTANNKNYIVGKSFHVSESDAVFTELIGVEVEGLEAVPLGGVYDVRWRINSGKVCDFSCDIGNETWDDKSATSSWDSSVYSENDVVEMSCNLTVGWDRSFTIFDGESEICYQEFANQTPVDCLCGVSGDGTYDVQDKYIYVNYSKPVGALSNSKWIVKYGLELNGTWDPIERNVTIPSLCWNAFTDKLSLRMYSLMDASHTLESHGECYNGTDWERITPISYTYMSSPYPLYIANSSSNAFDGNWSTHSIFKISAINNWYDYGVSSLVEKGYWWEEAMLWDISVKTVEVKHFSRIVQDANLTPILNAIEDVNNTVNIIINNTVTIIDGITREWYVNTGNPFNCTFYDTGGGICGYGNDGNWISGSCAGAAATNPHNLYYAYENYSLYNMSCNEITWTGRPGVGGVDDCNATYAVEIWNPLILSWEDLVNITYNFAHWPGGGSLGPYLYEEIDCSYVNEDRILQFRYPILYDNVCGSTATDYTLWCESSINVTADVINFVQDLWALAQVEAEGVSTVFKGENATNGWRIDMGFGTVTNLDCNYDGSITYSNNRVEIEWTPDQIGNIGLACNLSILPRYSTDSITGEVKQYVRVIKGLGAWMEH